MASLGGPRQRTAAVATPENTNYSELSTPIWVKMDNNRVTIFGVRRPHSARWSARKRWTSTAALSAAAGLYSSQWPNTCFPG